MKILITSIIDIVNSQHSRLHEFIKYLSERHDITILCINDWWKSKQSDMRIYAKDFDEIFSKVNILYLTDKRISPIIQEIFSLKKISEVASERFDVHLNYGSPISGYIAARRINTVFDIADDLGAMIRVSPQIPWLLRPFGSVLGDFLIKENIDRSKMITVTHENLVEHYNIPENKCKVIPNGVDTRLFRDYGSMKRDELGLDGFILGYIGVLREWVDLKPVFLALKELNEDIKMIIIGGEGNLKQNVDLALQCGLEDRVVFIGTVPYSQTPMFISAMDVCIIPFRRGAISDHSLPLKLFEYMACKKPIISTELAGVKKIIGENILYANSCEDYVNQISKTYMSNKLRSQMGEYGRNFVTSNYDWSEITKDLEKVLYKTIS